MSQQFYFAYHVDQISRLAQLGQLSAIEEYAQQLELTMQEELRPWLEHVLLKNFDNKCKNEALSLTELRLKGWQVYHAHDYLAAHQYFVQVLAHQEWPKSVPDSALGLAKVYTRTGHWQAAQDWCLYYLFLARRSLSHFDIAKGYGALAEIFLRANYPQQALACFQIAYHLMPVGHGQQARQYNFMASALMRHHEWLRAETLLYTSSQISHNQLKIQPTNLEAKISLCHTNMRFCYLNLIRSGQCSPMLINDDTTLKTALDLTAVPTGLMWMAVGISHLKNGTNARQQFELALQRFSPKLIMEYQWAVRLRNACDTGNASDVEIVQGITEIFALKPIDVPQSDVVFDHTWQQVVLPQQGFLPLIQTQNKQQLADLWSLFFI